MSRSLQNPASPFQLRRTYMLRIRESGSDTFLPTESEPRLREAIFARLSRPRESQVAVLPLGALHRRRENF